jgi:hypothetical protein
VGIFVSKSRKLSPLGWFGWLLFALPALQVAYLRAFFGCDDAVLRYGDDRTCAFFAFTVGKSDLWHDLVALECLADTDACESHGSGDY